MRIDLALGLADKSHSQLARFLNTQQSTVNGWIKGGRIPAASSILPICEFTGVSPIWLLSGKEEDLITNDAMELAHAYDKLDKPSQRAIWGYMTAEQRRMEAEVKNTTDIGRKTVTQPFNEEYQAIRFADSFDKPLTDEQLQKTLDEMIAVDEILSDNTQDIRFAASSNKPLTKEQLQRTLDEMLNIEKAVRGNQNVDDDSSEQEQD